MPEVIRRVGPARPGWFAQREPAGPCGTCRDRLRDLTIVISTHVSGVGGADVPARRVRLQALVSRLEAVSGVAWSTRDTELPGNGRMFRKGERHRLVFLIR